ncbi:protein disulfide isomerase-like 1-4 [Cajanus cajan]|uniref:Protein disulfide-isomerase n=1 Tax=Cajanus cajan TaxID=3821 RepID=A0A151TN87_CAJCA|nr:protein disulfide isomerase-like 1-4 [Cajanus cajan]KYP68525.1 Protein disulfide-isomerase [Cajanus cajan]
MPTLTRLVVSLSLATLLLLSSFSLTLCNKAPQNDNDDDDEDLSFLEEPHDATATSHHHFPDPDQFDDDDGDDADDFGDFSGYDPSADEAFADPAVDDKDVVVLKERNFTTVVENNRFVMVEFYAPWCGHCQALAPEYAAAATELKPDGVVLAKVDATVENELAHEYDVQGFPTVFFFVDGAHKPYTAQRTKDAIVTWIRKKIGPGVSNITTLDDAESVLTSESRVVLGFLNSLVGAESDELAAASKLEDDVNFYQTVVPEVAKLFHIDASAKRPALILLKKEEEKLNHFDGEFVKAEIAEFVSSNKLPLVTTFTRENAPSIFESQIKKQLLLFVTSNDTEKFLPVFKETAKLFKGKLIFVHVEMDNEDVGKPVADYFGLAGNAPKVLAYTGNDDGRKFLLDGEVTVDTITAFGKDFLEDKLKPFLKSDPVPESNDGDVKIVVGNSFDEIVLDESKDVLLEVYAPWCGHCQSLEPTYNKLAKHLSSIESIVIAKMDGTTNEHPRAKADGFPTLLFFPAGNKTSDPIPVDVDRTVVAFYKFLRKHASIPFKLQKPTSTSKSGSGSSDVKESQSSSTDVKDEL